MRVHHRFLYVGIFLLAIGGVIVAADLGAIDTPTLTDALRLWPLALVAIGLSLVLRRTRAVLPLVIVAAALPGLVLGAAFAVVPRFAGDCGARGDAQVVATPQGTFEGPATVVVRGGCGSVSVTTAPGNGWRLDARNTAGRAPTVDSSPGSLSIDGRADHGPNVLDAGRDDWDLTLPTSEIDRVSLVLFAGDAHVRLPGAQIDRLALTANAADIDVDASGASVGELSGVINVGSLSIRLPSAGDLVGSVRVGGGELRICSAAGSGLRITAKGQPRQFLVEGLQQHASEWQSSDYASATHRADLSVNVNFGVIEIDPIGGCE